MLVDFPRGLSTMTIAIAGSYHFESHITVTPPSPEPSSNSDETVDASFSWAQAFTRLHFRKLARGVFSDPALDVNDRSEIPEWSFMLVADPLAPSRVAIRLIKIPNVTPVIGTSQYHFSGFDGHDSFDNSHSSDVTVSPHPTILWLDSMRAWPSVYNNIIMREKVYIPPFIPAPFNYIAEVPEAIDTRGRSFWPGSLEGTRLYPYRTKRASWADEEHNPSPVSTPTLNFEASRVQAAVFNPVTGEVKPEIQRIILGDGNYPKLLSFVDFPALDPDEAGYDGYDRTDPILPALASSTLANLFGSGVPRLPVRYPSPADMWKFPLIETALANYYTGLSATGYNSKLIEVVCESYKRALIYITPNKQLYDAGGLPFPLLKGKSGPYGLELEPSRPFESGEGRCLIGVGDGNDVNLSLGEERFDGDGNLLNNPYSLFDVADKNPSLSFEDSDSQDTDTTEDITHQTTHLEWNYSLSVTFS
jgi:hypothetical protein